MIVSSMILWDWEQFGFFFLFFFLRFRQNRRDGFSFVIITPKMWWTLAIYNGARQMGSIIFNEVSLLKQFWLSLSISWSFFLISMILFSFLTFTGKVSKLLFLVVSLFLLFLYLKSYDKDLQPLFFKTRKRLHFFTNEM